MTIVRLGLNGDFGFIEFDDNQEIPYICESQFHRWSKVYDRTKDLELSSVGTDQAVKWQALRTLTSETSVLSMDSTYLSGLVQTFSNDFDLMAIDSPIAAALQQGNRDPVATRLPVRHDSALVEARLAEFRAAAVAIRAVTDRPDPRALHLTMLESSLSDITSQLDHINEKIFDLRERASSVASDFQSLEASAKNSASDAERSAVESIQKAAIASLDTINISVSEFWNSVKEKKAVIDSEKNSIIFDKPVRFWNEERKRHGDNAKKRIILAVWSAILTAILTPVVVLKVFEFSWRYLPYASLSTARLVFAGVSGLTVLTFGLWGTRIAVRSYMAEEHLKNDALNRVAITNAFIKLQAAVGMSDADRAILLNTIMRPSQDGIVQDDGLPPTMPSAILAKAIDQAASLTKR